MPRHKRTPRRLTKSQFKNWTKTKRAAARSKNKNRPLFKRKFRNFKPSTLRGKPQKVGTGHWLTTTKTIRPMKGWLKLRMKGTNKGYRNDNQASQAVSVIGQQVVFNDTKWNMWTPFDVFTITNAVSTTSNQAVLINCTLKLFATNQSNACQFVEIYEAVNKRDISTGETEVTNPVLAWQNNGSLLANSNYTNPGATPFEFQSFTTFYKVLKITRYNLNPGETFEHVWSDTVNTVIHPQTILEFNADAISTVGVGGLKGMTKWMFLTQWSAPYNDSTTKTQVSLGAGNVDFVLTKKFSIGQITGLSSVGLSNVNALPQAFTVAEDIMNDDSGAAVAFANA